MIKPDYIIESSWEVCNKVGGIYTVLSSKAHTLNKEYNDNLIFIGPDLDNSPSDFLEDKSLFAEWIKSLPVELKVKTGRWDVPGRPVVFLVDYKYLYPKKNELYYEIWDFFKVDSYNAYGDYDESCIFAYSTGLVIEHFYNYYKLENKKVTALFNEWTLGMGALYIKKHVPRIATLFTTHATTVGRSIAGNNKPLYGYMSGYDGDQMAYELNVQAKHSLEKQTARFVDCFTTVSDITAIECSRLLEKRPDIVTPNGFENRFVPAGEKYTKNRKEARDLLLNVAGKLTGKTFDDDTFLVATSGRYEYRNKGQDIFIDVINNLRDYNPEREVVAYIIVPAWAYAPRADLKYLMENNETSPSPLQFPYITHWLNNFEEDKMANYILQKGYNQPDTGKTKIIFVPCYIDYNDGIFNKSYYDILIGMDATVFASYYEPWGYTPLESIAFGIPTITTNLAGFGLWAETFVSGKDINEGVAVIERNDDNYNDVVHNITETLFSLIGGGEPESIRDKCFELASKTAWKHFIKYYNEAFDIALQKAIKRIY
jgi:glycosyltransferase involved in cell wall biosynthesis